MSNPLRGESDSPEQRNPRGTLGRLAMWIRAAHPVPSLVVAGLTAIFSASVGLPWLQVVLVFVAMLTNQLSIGLGNDWWDAPQDLSAGRRDKPLVTGDMSRTFARNLAFLLSGVALGVSALLGPWAVACQAVMLAAGWWYNVHAKRHWTSPLSYLLGFGLLPVFPLLSLTPPAFPPLWVVIVAALLGLSAHFANALPDLSGDRDSGVRGLPQILGPKRSGLVLLAGILSATLTISIAGTSLPLWMRVLTLALALGAAGVATALSFRHVPPRVIFPLVMGSAGVSVVAIATHFVLS